MDTELADKFKTAVQSNDTQLALQTLDQACARGYNVNDPLPTSPKSFENNWTPHFWACLCPTTAVLSSILEQHRGKVDVRDSSGYTPLLFAGFHGKFTAVRCLVEHGADIHAQSQYGETLEDLVLKKPYNERERELREYVEKLLRA